MVGTTVSHYEILEKLGGGGMGVVYRARDTRLDRDVALKFLPPAMASDDDAKARFVQEARAASALDHPNICTIHDIGESDDGQMFIAMAFYDGATLKYRLKDGALPPGEAASIAFQIAQGLRGAHDAGIVHRDIKPANAIVTRDGQVRILDFGVAKLGTGLDLTQTGSTVGTAAYMSPEQARGEQVDARADLWSLGAILYEMLSGQRPFGGAYDQAVLYSILNADPAPLTDVPEALAQTVARLLTKDRTDRFGSAQDVMDALEPYASGVSRAADGTRSTRSLDTGKRTRLVKWGVPVVAAVLVLALAIARISSSGASSSPDPIDQNLIAVFPFTVQGSEDMDYLSESMVTLLTTKLDGTGSFYVVDDAVVIEQTRLRQGVIGPAAGAELARQFGAGHFILGSVIRAGDEIQISARRFQTDGTPANEASTSYREESGFMAAIDNLASGLVSGLLTNPNQDLSALAAGTTESFAALQHYLEAEKLTRTGDFEPAREEVDAALALDSTFALAWYLRADIEGWLSVGTMGPYLDKAAQYGDRLTGRARRLLDAHIAFSAGEHLEAERLYQALLRDYPNDLEATGQLAEVYVHYSSSEAKHREALALIDKVSRMTPGSQQFAIHHADLLALVGKLDGDRHPLDSLAATYAGVAPPERGDTLDWSSALDRMNPNAATAMTLHARINGSPEDSAASYRRDGSDIDAFRAFSYGHPDVALATIRTVGHDPGLDEVSPPFNFERLARLALGQRDAAAKMDVHLMRTGSGPESWVDEVLTVAIRAFEVATDSLRRLRTRVDQWDPVANPLTGYPDDSHLVQAYLRTLLSYRAGDRASFTRDLAAYRAHEPDSANHPLWRSVSAELRALDYLQRGELGLAASAMQDAVVRGRSFLDQDIMTLRMQPVWYLGEIRLLQGELRSAIEQFTSVVGFGPGMRFAAPGWERAAQLYEEVGEPGEAIRYYGLMIDLWRNADPDLQPRVAEARRKLDGLLDQLAREP